MTLRTIRAFTGLSFLLLVPRAWAQPHRGGPGEERHAEGEARHDDHHEGHPEERRGDPRALPPRPAPPQFQAHPPGVHPRGPTGRPHAVRILTPRRVPYGHGAWRHWEHPAFDRPVYYWNWSALHGVTCIAEDSYGDQYPVSESSFRGFGLVNMTVVEDDALDRCNAESGGDPSCYLASCTPY